MADRVEQQLGNYQLVALLGQGSFADVYLGQHVRLPLQVAIKVLRTHLTAQEAEHFQQEAETIARLAQPSIVRILDYDVQEGVPFLVMDYAPHGSLRRRYPKGTVVPLPEIVSCVKQIAAALHYAHEQKVIHRDVKPENILVGRHEEVLLSDFGLAALAHSSASLSTQEAMGTLAYMAPEQIEGYPRAASDQYALGVLVYEWLCGSRPFDGSFSEVIVQHLSMPPPPLRERVPTISSEVEQVVFKALAKDRRQRFTSVQEFAVALEVASTAASTGSTRLMLDSVYAAEARLTTKPHLPAYLTPLLGREKEIVEASALLRRHEVRLVTLTGPGGIGKTRLAVQLTMELLADFADGVSFASLAPISDPDLVIPTIAQMLEVKESGTHPPLDLLKAFLQDKHVLLVLDNFEQLLPAAPHLTDLLTSCPCLNILVTSRATLHVQGEHEFLVPPLSVPDHTHLPEQDALSQYAAVALFLQHAQAVKPAFQLTSCNARPIAEICARLDGLPLAIELAAARIKLLPPQALLARLSQRMHLLTGGAQDVPARQQTLRNTITWSYNLLDATEQRLFRWLSVFVSGCTLEAVEAVCSFLDSGTDAGWVLERVASLSDKSLIQQTEQDAGEPRFVMLETIREYGLEALALNKEMESTRQAHATHYLRFSEEAEPELHGPQQAVWLERLEQEHDNLRAALEWALEDVADEQAAKRRDIALRLSAALWHFWWMRGHYSEARTFLEQALARSEGASVSLRVKVLQACVSVTLQQGNYARTEALAEPCLALYRELGNTRGIADCLGLLVELSVRRGNMTEAITHSEERVRLMRQMGEPGKVAESLSDLAEMLSRRGELARVQSLFEEALLLYRNTGNDLGVATALLQSATGLWWSSLEDAATIQTIRHQLQEAQAIVTKSGSRHWMAVSSWLAALVALSEGETTRAESLAQESLAIWQEIGNRWGIAWGLHTRGRVEAQRGEMTAARSWYQQSLALTQELSEKLVAPYNLEGLAGVVAVQGELAWAAQLWGAAESLREATALPLPPVDRADYERSVAAARTQLGEKAFATAWTQGRAMTPELALVAKGQVKIPAHMPTKRLSASPTTSQSNYTAGLTAREVEVLRLVVQGLTDAQVAEQLVISPRTVNSHLTTIYDKIGVTSRSAATRYAIEHQLV